MSTPIRAVERALDVLLCFSKQTPELSMTQIAERVGMHKSTVHRLLATLEGKRFVERDPVTGFYRPGIYFLQLTYLTLEHHDLRTLAAPFLQRLSEQFLETTNLGVLDGKDIFFVEVIESPQRVKLAAAIGQRLPAFSTASGKAILAFLPENTVRGILEDDFSPTTPYTLRTREALLENLRLTREQGFAISVQEYEEGINSVAAPIFNSIHRPIGSIAIAGPSFRHTRERMMEIAPQLVSVTQELSLVFEMSNHSES